MLTDEKITELKALAEAATRGDWEAFALVKGAWCIRTTYQDEASGRRMTSFPVVCNMAPAEPNKRNASFIAAANPKTILDLISRVEKAEGERKALIDLVHSASWINDDNELQNGWLEDVPWIAKLDEQTAQTVRVALGLRTASRAHGGDHD